MGRKPISDETARRVRGRPKRQPPAFHGPLIAPSRLSDAARDHWANLVHILESAGVATAGDAEALLLLAEAMADADAIRAELRATGYAVQTPTGRSVANPLLAALRSAERRCAALLGEFGMTPAARSKVRVDQVAPVDPIEAKYFGPRS